MESKTYTCLIWHYGAGPDLAIAEARRLTDAEKAKFTDEFRDKMFYTTGGAYTDLKHVSRHELPKRDDDGCFPGSSNRAWILTDEEKGYYLGLEKGLAQAETAAKAAEEKRRADEQDARRRRQEYDLRGVEWETEARAVEDEGGKTTEYIHHITVHGRTYDLVERNLFDVGKVINPLHGAGLARAGMVWDRFDDGVTVMDSDEARAVQLVMRYGRFSSSSVRM